MINEYINIDFVESNKECNACDYHNDYTCFDCENEQVKTVYPKATYFPLKDYEERYREVKE
jgi:hypothetical protein